MSDQLIVERSGLEKKEKGELQAIILALGGTASSRSRKSELIDQIMVLSGATEGEGDAGTAAEGSPGGAAGSAAGDGGSGPSGDTRPTAAASAPSLFEVDETDDRADDTTDDEIDDDTDAVDEIDDGDDEDDESDEDDGGSASARVVSTAPSDRSRLANGSAPDRVGQDRAGQDRAGQDRAGQDRAGQDRAGQDRAGQDRAGQDRGGQGNDNRQRRDDRSGSRSGNDRRDGRGAGHPVGPDGEPLADWELALAEGANQGQGPRGGNDRSDGADDVEGGNRRSRRRGRGRGRDREEVPFEPISADPIPVSGVLDLREEGYGFLRVESCLPSKDDVYVSVKQVRQYGLRKGDVLTGLARPATRNEKNPGFHQIDTVNGLPAEEGRRRVRFDDLTPLFPDERLKLEMREEPLNMTTRIIDLVAPIGKGQRALIVSPPKAGKTTVMKDIARAIETNNPEVRLIVLLLDERPEEVTDMSRQLTNGEVVASTFDRPPEEHCAVAELTIERAKRLVEAGEDVCIIVDGITRLARAYNLTAPQTGRAMSGGVDAGALYPPKRFFGAARNLEEGGSLTILATALVETGSRMDEVIFEEFKGTGNCEIRLDRRLAERRLYPAIDIDGSSTRHEELLFDRQQLQAAWKLRRVLSAMKSDDGTSAGAIEMLVDRLKTFKTNADFLNEIAKSPSL